MKRARRLSPVLLLIFITACAKSALPTVPTDILASQVEFMAAKGFDSLTTISASGTLTAKSEQGSGTVDFILLFDPRAGLRIEVVDPFYRPLQILLQKGEKLWVHDPRTQRTSSGEARDLLNRLTGISLPSTDYQPLLLGKIPPGDLAATPDKGCGLENKVACFDLRERNGRLRCMVEISMKDGRLAAVNLPKAGSEQIVIRAEYEGFHPEGIPRRVKVSHLPSGHFVVLRYSDLTAGQDMDPNLFEPDWLKRVQ